MLGDHVHERPPLGDDTIANVRDLHHGILKFFTVPSDASRNSVTTCSSLASTSYTSSSNAIGPCRRPAKISITATRSPLARSCTAVVSGQRHLNGALPPPTRPRPRAHYNSTLVASLTLSCDWTLCAVPACSGSAQGCGHVGTAVRNLEASINTVQGWTYEGAGTDTDQGGEGCRSNCQNLTTSNEIPSFTGLPTRTSVSKTSNPTTKQPTMSTAAPTPMSGATGRRHHRTDAGGHWPGRPQSSSTRRRGQTAAPFIRAAGPSPARSALLSAGGRRAGGTARESGPGARPGRR